MYILIKDVYILQETPFCLLAASDLVAVRQVEGLLSFVQVDKMCNIQVPQGVHHVPSIVLGDRDLKQVHILRSILEQKSVTSKKIRYLSIPMFVRVMIASDYR